MFDASHRRGHTSRLITLVTLLGLLGLLSAATPVVIAQEGTPASDTGAVEATEVPTEVPTEIPTEAPTETATDVPTELPATEAATEVATEIPVPTLSYAVATPPTCDLAPGQPGTIASGGSIEYVCVDAVSLSGASVVPANVTISWSSSVSVGGGWSVQMLPPVNPGEPEATWTTPGVAEAWFEFRQVSPIGAGTEPVAIDQVATIQYHLRLTRTLCATDSQTVAIDRSIGVGTTDATTVVTANQVATEPRYITPELAPIPEPAVAFDGPLALGEIAVTADGPVTSTASGAVSMTIANLDQACGAWTLKLAATPLTGDSGMALNGSQLVAISVNGEALPEPCDLTAGCDLASLGTGPDTPSTQTISVGVELRLSEQPNTGSFNTSLTAALHPAATDRD